MRPEPAVREGLRQVSEGCVFIYCPEGEKTYCKDPKKDFRKNLKVTVLPTLLNYGTAEKLVEPEGLPASWRCCSLKMKTWGGHRVFSPDRLHYKSNRILALNSR